MFRSWVKWCINNNMKFVVYIVWFLILPLFLLTYLGEAAKDAAGELEAIKNAKKGNV